jgi:ribosomal protein S18 acetylase RimI-like enzyme
MALRLIPPGPARDAFLPLLYLADDAHAHVRRHRDEGDLFVLDLDGGGHAAVQTVRRGDEEVEFTLVAVDEAHQGRGRGKALIAATLEHLAGRGVRRVVVGTATAGLDQIAFYQKCGFRPFAIERDYFNVARGDAPDAAENGIPIRDMLWFDYELS